MSREDNLTVTLLGTQFSPVMSCHFPDTERFSSRTTHNQLVGFAHPIKNSVDRTSAETVAGFFILRRSKICRFQVTFAQEVVAEQMQAEDWRKNCCG